MRIAAFVAAVGLASFVSACAGGATQGASRAENAQALEYGNYLSARFAASLASSEIAPDGIRPSQYR